MKKIVLVTAGGHISAFHAGMAKINDALRTFAHGRFELCGAVGGVGGLNKGQLMPIKEEHIKKDRAGSFFGCDREIAHLDSIKRVVREQNIYAIIMMGGDDHLGQATRCYDVGIPIVGWPKTMDGDLNSPISLGWHTAVTVGAQQIRNHHNSAITNNNVFFVGLFGRDTDWVLTASSWFGGADLAIPGERKYSSEYVFERIRSAIDKNRKIYGIPFAVVPYSEGAKIEGIENPPWDVKYDTHGRPKLEPEWIGLQLKRLASKFGLKTQLQVHSYDMRDSPPTEIDTQLAAMAGVECVQMILDGDFGKSVIFEHYTNGNSGKSADIPYRSIRTELAQAAKKRFVLETEYFNYKDLVPAVMFGIEYGSLFPGLSRRSKDELVYPHMIEHRRLVEEAAAQGVFL